MSLFCTGENILHNLHILYCTPFDPDSTNSMCTFYPFFFKAWYHRGILKGCISLWTIKGGSRPIPSLFCMPKKGMVSHSSVLVSFLVAALDQRFGGDHEPFFNGKTNGLERYYRRIQTKTIINSSELYILLSIQYFNSLAVQRLAALFRIWQRQVNHRWNWELCSLRLFPSVAR